MRIQSIVAASLLSMMGCSLSLAASDSVDATFERDDPSNATMTLTAEGEAWRVVFRAGGIPNGAATAADCELEAVGPQDLDGVIAAQLVPFEGELYTMTAADIGADAPVIQVAVGPEGVFVTDAGAADRFCGLGSDIEGFYLRTGAID
ncbi:hypothetical protein WH87_04190 [Devosia epidermidihirudinis]|uniref:Alkaline proteinase inhibitor/ Outer membrane lipoprotein Omp19 domain-containing protein n=1 Tax=Devosia epidermidihirudinis TaxID=1293439 RepID=A0A0F5QF99_9HYPH|nr:hypothetical protein [Devosia epidermidihirudinis]KKC39421.1 hypothetical protein WH87_04190 [Devosia epidermidihirudinis]